MRRVLTAGLALYLGLGGVLSSPLQVQVPFVLNEENNLLAGDIPASAGASESSLYFFPPSIVVAASPNVCPGSRESRLIPDPCDLGPPRQLQGRFLHITDLHPDPLYLVGSAVSSGCHRDKPAKDKSRARYLGTPYESVMFTFLTSVLVPENLIPKLWICNAGVVADFNLDLPFL
jgi:hypothetical protein